MKKGMMTRISYIDEIPEKEIIERCKYCTHCMEIRDYHFFDITKVVDCKIHGSCGWFYWSETLQNCSTYKQTFEGIMKEIIEKEEKLKP
jgi:hypothetical protein